MADHGTDGAFMCCTVVCFLANVRRAELRVAADRQLVVVSGPQTWPLNAVVAGIFSRVRRVRTMIATRDKGVRRKG